MSNICFILSSVGGPRLLSSIFFKNFRKDVSYLIFQHMPNEEFITALIQCFQSETSSKIEYVKQDSKIQPGGIYFLSTRESYSISEQTIVLKSSVRPESDSSHPIDSLLESAVESDNNNYNVIVLSGMLIDQDGIKGITRLKEKGARVYTLPAKDIPIDNMVEDLKSLDLIDEVFSCGAILANLDFASDSPGAPENSHWLVVDDEEQIRTVISDILSMENIKSDTAVDGLDALRKIQKNKYAAMILDINMPELDGLQTLEALQTIDPDIPILIVTGYDDEQTKRAGENDSVKGTLLKPFTSADLKMYLPQMTRTG